MPEHEPKAGSTAAESKVPAKLRKSKKAAPPPAVSVKPRNAVVEQASASEGVSVHPRVTFRI